MGSAQEDLTTRARIRDAAVRLYGRDGFARTTVRSVAAAAGVSPALVIHHFRSTAELRRACDEHVLSGPTRIGHEKTDPDRFRTLLHSYLAEPERYRGILDYISSSLTEASPAGDAFFDAVVENTQELIEAGIADGTIRAFDDVQAVAVLVASHSMASLTLRRHLARTLGAGDLDVELTRRLGLPALELYTHGFYTDGRFLDAARSAPAASTHPAPPGPS